MTSKLSDGQPWQHWFDAFDSTEDLRSRVTQRFRPISDLHSDSPVFACERLDKLWRGTYVPSDDQLEVIQQFVELAKFNATLRLPSPETYQEAVYSRRPILQDDPDIWSLTGLAGVGKSSTMRALTSLLTPTEEVARLVPGMQIQPRPVIHIKIGAARASSAVLRSLSNPVFVAGRSNIPQPELLKHLREWLFVQSTLVLLVDELQFLTRSDSASTQIANLLSELNQLGPTVAYIFNYSLGHKLMARQQEDKDRLLARRVGLPSPTEGDPHWMAALSAYIGVAPDFFDIDADRHAAELHRLTGGILRLLRLLLLSACRLVWSKVVDRAVTMADVRAAYHSGYFSSQREDVEALRSLPFNQRLRERRKDLVCPFPDMSDLKTPNTGSPKTSSHPPTPSPAVMHMMESAISATGRQVLKELRAAAERSGAGDNQPAKVARLRGRTKVTAEALLAGAKLLTSPSSNRPSTPPASQDNEA